jgi:hypothetical protein
LQLDTGEQTGIGGASDRCGTIKFVSQAKRRDSNIYPSTGTGDAKRLDAENSDDLTYDRVGVFSGTQIRICVDGIGIEGEGETGGSSRSEGSIAT